MCTWENNPATGARTPSIMGYAAFEGRYTTDEEFARWFSPITTGLTLVSAGDVRRLVAIQHGLVALIDKLDPKRRYTAGYELTPIDLSDNA